MSSLPEESSVLRRGEQSDKGEGEVGEGEYVQDDSRKPALSRAVDTVVGNDVVGDGGRMNAGGSSSKVLEYLHSAREEDAAEESRGTSFQGYKKINHGGQEGDDAPAEAAPVSSPTIPPGSPDDTLSVQDSVISSPANSRYAYHLSPFHSPSPSLRPFDRRFQSRIQPTPSPVSPSPSLFNFHSRTPSATGQIEDLNRSSDDGGAPWDVIRWTKLTKITNQVFSEAGRRNFGSPTCIAVSATITIGTSKGIILVFDYHQHLKNIIGPGTKAIECGSVTALAVSADHTTIAAGHSQGNIFTWELAKPARPFLSIPPVASSVLEGRKVDGHVEGVSVLHLGFLGTRHTALVSADGKGMAFSHLATRGLGAIARIVKTTRILGRYPFDVPASGRPRKPSSVLAFSPLPLGNSVQATDSMGLVAVLTPHVLVVISTTPVAETQHEASRPKGVATDKALSGALAWFPAVKLKESALSSDVEPKPSKPKLAYSWSNILTLLELTIIEPELTADPNTPPTLQFKAKSRWECDEAIVAVQWISRQIIGVLTVTQRLIIIEEPTLRVTETFDLMPKQILHSKLFAYHLNSLVGAVDDEASSHRAIADAFYNSFKTYKGRIFLLCRYQVSVGALSNWADRLLAMMEVGDFIGAIRLATAYYVGEADKLTVGLPEEAHLRHPLVAEKLVEMVAASLRYAFGKTAVANRTEILGKEQLYELATVCFVSCLCMGNINFLFDEVYDHYEGGGYESIFLEILEPYILEGRITSIPPAVVKALISHFTTIEQEGRLEEMICHMDTRTLDIDQVTTLCKQHNLYDALIYVWNRALGDYITPMIDLLSLLRPLFQKNGFQNEESNDAVNALKIFPYLSYTLTGRIYPTGELMSGVEAICAKAVVYYFLFLGRTIVWPRQGGTPFLTKQDGTPEESFPYLRLILHFDAPSFLSALNEAFEDPFLNGPADQSIPDASGEGKREVTEEQMFARSVNRQYIITILLEVMNSNDFPPQDTIYLNMFIARNLPKFPQFIILSGTTLHKILVGLCNYPGPDIADDCQLSVEYLLSVYRLPDVDGMVELFIKSRFYRVLKSIFRSEKQYAKLFTAYLKDEEAQDAVFGCIEECLRPQSAISSKQAEELKEAIVENARRLVDIDNAMTAKYIDEYARDLHGQILDTIQDRPEDQFIYLRTVMEQPSSEQGGGLGVTAETMKRPEIMSTTPSLVELYVRLMCKYNAKHVPDFVGRLQSGDLRLEEVIPDMEESGVVDATVQLMAREGKVGDAMDRLLGHLRSLEAGLLGVLQAKYENSSSTTGSGNNGKDGINRQIQVNEGTDDLLAALRKYTQVGIWLCQGQRSYGRIKGKQLVNGDERGNGNSKDKDALTKEELLWLDFIDTLVQITKNCTAIAAPHSLPGSIPYQAVEINGKIASPITHPTNSTMVLRNLVQDAFTALLTSSTPSFTITNTTTAVSSSVGHTSFLRILRAFLSRASISHPSLSDLRSVLAGIFDAYTYENQLLSLANKLLDKDRFKRVNEAVKLRRSGWRPISQACEACGRRAWGPGAAGGIYAAWERRRKEETLGVRERSSDEPNHGGVERNNDGSEAGVGRGKGKAPIAQGNKPQRGSQDKIGLKREKGKGETEEGALVVFVCRHVYHRGCLDKLRDNYETPSATTITSNRDGGGARGISPPPPPPPPPPLPPSQRALYKCVVCEETKKE